jgi:signal transduction histidine kinase
MIDGRIERDPKDIGQCFDLKDVFGSESTKPGLGLMSMRERTELAGGSFAIEPTDSGTVIKAPWPLSPQLSDAQ